MFKRTIRYSVLVSILMAGSAALAATMTLDFGSVAVYDTRSRRVSYYNNTDQTMENLSITGGSRAFRVFNNCPDHLYPGARCTIRVDFRPDFPQSYRSTVRISSSAGTDLIRLRGWGNQRNRR